MNLVLSYGLFELLVHPAQEFQRRFDRVGDPYGATPSQGLANACRQPRLQPTQLKLQYLLRSLNPSRAAVLLVAALSVADSWSKEMNFMSVRCINCNRNCNLVRARCSLCLQFQLGILVLLVHVAARRATDVACSETWRK
jgi:hypothetical protein